jgi:hypothetical protein
MITADTQVKGLFKRMSEGTPLYVSAQQSGMCENTARKYRNLNRFPSELSSDHNWRTHPDPFRDVWSQVEALLIDNPILEAKTAFEWLQREYPQRFVDGQLRTLQRRFHQWRAEYGKAKEVFFPQDHHPGELGASDFTWMTDLQITIGGCAFDHMLYHYVLTWSNWECGTICFSESYESLSTGLQNAWWRCGGVPLKHRTDRLSAAINNLDDKRELTAHYGALMRHYDVAGQKTNPNSGNENGDVEQSHHRIKRAVKQALILRGSNDFAKRQEYEQFVNQLLDRRNQGRRDRFTVEQQYLRPLPARRLPDYTELRGVLVSKASTILVRKNVYSVHSRLRDEHVTVKLYAENLAVVLGSTLVESIPRLRGTENHRINYRHIIDWLVRKPGAFANYRYRSDLFPTSQFRIAYDLLHGHCPARADKEYLQILYNAAYSSEDLVNLALQKLIAQGTIPTAALVCALVKMIQTNGITSVIDPHVAPVKLAQYDALLYCKEAAL